MKKITVTIITLNEAERLGRTLNAVRHIADEIVVVDSKSTDETIKIAADAGARVITNAFAGYGQQKRFAEDHATNDWILNLDADEEVTPALATELAEWKAREADAIACYEVDILNVYPGEVRPRPFAQDYRVVRLYDRSIARYADHPVYDRVEVPDGITIGTFKAPIFHHPFVSWKGLAEKGNRFSKHEVGRVARKGLPSLLVRLFLEYPHVFMKTWLFRRHIFGGFNGLLFSHYNARMRFKRILNALIVKYGNGSLSSDSSAN